MIKVSTIIPAYNAERTIAQAIDSALSQDYEGHEVVVVNDGSTDSTVAILQKYGSQIQVITQANGGLSVARNAAVRRSTGKYLAFLDADDIWLPGKLKTMVSALERNPLASLAFSEYRYLDSNGVECGGSAFSGASGLEELMRERPLPVLSFPTGILPSTWVIPRQVFERTGGCCERFKGAEGFDDHWMLLLLSELGEFVYVTERLTLYRVSDSGKVANKYGPGVAIFILLVRERYGAAGKALIRNAKRAQCRSLLSKVAFQMNNGDKLGAIRTFARIARLRPAYFLDAEFRARLFLPQNLKRVRDLVTLPYQSEHRSCES
jgi:glycosyltransferase involved in cell wall biosynthesis